MAGLVRLRSIQKLVGRLNTVTTTKTKPIIVTQNLCRYVGTSDAQKSETATTDICKTAETTPKKYWVSYGFNDENPELDKHMMHVAMFVSVSIALTLGAYMLIYMPDFRQKDWALREAYLELRRRESLGLPPIDPNLIDPAKVVLPTDEELGDQEIII